MIKKVLSNNDVLYLTIKKQFFDQIISGQKTKEYRDETDYWYERLTVIENGRPVAFKPFKFVRFCVGYSKTRDEAVVELKDLYLFRFIEDSPEGFKKGDQVFILELGKIKSKKTV